MYGPADDEDRDVNEAPFPDILPRRLCPIFKTEHVRAEILVSVDVPSRCARGKRSGSPIVVTERNSFQNVTIAKPELKETTGAFTRNINKDARYWKAPLLFVQGNNRTRVLRVQNVIVSTNPTTNEQYGKTYAYVGLPAYVRDFIRDAVSKYAKVSPDEARFEPDVDFWWKTASNIEDLATTISAAGDVTAHPVAEILEKTGRSFSVAAEIAVDVKYKTVDKSGYSPDTSMLGTRPFVSTSGGKIKPEHIVTTTADASSDAVISMLAALGLN
ncbi:hypothetical protein MAPG_03359 [Magnaporthiopsis poae ATCC 64411]|uniref:Uncharacterized protein n=1 Tax=Magnaporthiopsis poae (strain ATCC 64411 / 73-15) TaxID=644358 RepID=A0A0C4DTT5_MAGP6|nr:hypothetical protein MAPG_03359 [Magnaporthiopsis poae ATCC 64411]